MELIVAAIIAVTSFKGLLDPWLNSREGKLAHLNPSHRVAKEFHAFLFSHASFGRKTLVRKMS